MVVQERFKIQTRGHRHMQDVTKEVAESVRLTGIRSGLVHIFNIGSTAVVGTVEYEPGLKADLPELLDRLIPPSTHYGHEQAWHDGNGHSHLQASCLGPDVTIPVSQGELVLGTWQQIFHLECDVKPRTRTLVLTVYGD